MSRIQDVSDKSKFYYRCQLCSKLSYGCQLCREIEEGQKTDQLSEYANPLFRSQAMCTTCIDGFFYSYKQKRCLPNAPYCQRQVEWFTGTTEFYKCDQCIRNYSFDQETMLCQKNEAKFKYCVFSYSNEACSVCEDGYFNTKEGGCQKCHPSCPTCNGPTENDCSSCSYQTFRLTLRKNDKSVWVDPLYKCVQNCSLKLGDKSFVESLTSNECLEKTE